MVDKEILSHWQLLVDDFNTSALEFYAAVEQAVGERQVPDTQLSRVLSPEGGILSAKREYLRIKRGKVLFEIGAAPFGTGYFFSWWMVRPGLPYAWMLLLPILFLLPPIWMLLVYQFGFFNGSVALPVLLLLAGMLVSQAGADVQDLVLEVPFVGWLYEKLFRPPTYYRIDTALMFQESVRRAVNDVINGLLDAKGLRALTEDQRKPTIRDLA